jgi:chromosome segregation ATPase
MSTTSSNTETELQKAIRLCKRHEQDPHRIRSYKSGDIVTVFSTIRRRLESTEKGIEDEKDSHNHTVQTLKLDNEELQDQVKQLNKDRERLENHINQLNKDNDNLHTKLEEWENYSKNFVAQIQREEKALKAKFDDLEKYCEQANDRVLELEKENTSLRQTLETQEKGSSETKLPAVTSSEFYTSPGPRRLSEWWKLLSEDRKEEERQKVRNEFPEEDITTEVDFDRFANILKNS